MLYCFAACPSPSPSDAITRRAKPDSRVSDLRAAPVVAAIPIYCVSNHLVGLNVGTKLPGSFNSDLTKRTELSDLGFETIRYLGSLLTASAH